MERTIIQDRFRLDVRPSGRGLTLSAGLTRGYGMIQEDNVDLAYDGGLLFFLEVNGSPRGPGRHALSICGMGDGRVVSCRRWLRAKRLHLDGYLDVLPVDQAPAVTGRNVLLCAAIPEEMRP